MVPPVIGTGGFGVLKLPPRRPRFKTNGTEVSLTRRRCVHAGEPSKKLRILGDKYQKRACPGRPNSVPSSAITRGRYLFRSASKKHQKSSSLMPTNRARDQGDGIFSDNSI
jgi:hypothetical protein